MYGEARRRFLKAGGALALAFAQPRLVRAAQWVPVADSHTHIGMQAGHPLAGSLKDQMAAAGVTMIAWSIVSDRRWTERTDHGIEQKATPGPGEQGRYFRRELERMRDYLAARDLAYVRGPADIDAARAGSPRVVIAVEGAGFAADGIELIEQAYAEGLRHLQLVHYIRNALGDFQTEAPEHGGLTPLGAEVVKACNRLGILVDLAHGTRELIDRALEVSSVPPIWSHSDITAKDYDWRDRSARSRLLRTDYARKIAARGGAVGLWSLRASVHSSPAGYAAELMRMVDAIGPEHVMFGTDMDGVGRFGVMDSLGDLRKVADLLRARGMDENTLRAVCFENYARCLRAALRTPA
jgi:membrane dipeptidase